MKFAVFAGLCLSLLINVGLSAKAEAQSASGWAVRQSMQGQGQSIVNVSSVGGKIISDKVTCFISPANEQSALYNSENRKMCRVAGAMSIGRKAVFGPISKGSPTIICGQKAMQYYGWAYKVGTNPPELVCYVEFFTWENDKIPKRVAYEYSSLLGLPKGYGMPLRAIGHYNYQKPGYKKTIWLDTVAITPVTMTAADMRQPGGYQLAKDDLEVLMGDLDEPAAGTLAAERQAALKKAAAARR